MPGPVEQVLGATIGFVTKPVGAAVALIAVTAAVSGGLYVKNWWDDVQQMDETIVSQGETITGLTGDLRQSQLDAASARTAFGRREADLQRQIGIGSEEARWARARLRGLQQRIEELQDDETGPVSPVLVNALNSVRDDLRGFTPVA